MMEKYKTRLKLIEKEFLDTSDSNSWKRLIAMTDDEILSLENKETENGNGSKIKDEKKLFRISPNPSPIFTPGRDSASPEIEYPPYRPVKKSRNWGNRQKQPFKGHYGNSRRKRNERGGNSNRQVRGNKSYSNRSFQTTPYFNQGHYPPNRYYQTYTPNGTYNSTHLPLPQSNPTNTPAAYFQGECIPYDTNEMNASHSFYKAHALQVPQTGTGDNIPPRNNQWRDPSGQVYNEQFSMNTDYQGGWENNLGYYK